MSAGDVDDRLGPEGKLEELRQEYPALNRYLLRTLPIIQAYPISIPFTGGISKDGGTRYLDWRLKTIFRGKDIRRATARHEQVEWGLREYCGIGEDYEFDPRGHRLANRAEMEELSHIFEITSAIDEQGLWDAYDDFMDPQVRRIEHGPIQMVPKDLALYPYKGTHLERKMEEKVEEEHHKATKKEAEYETFAVKEQCQDCSMFITPDGCTAVEGKIDPEGHCKYWKGWKQDD